MSGVTTSVNTTVHMKHSFENSLLALFCHNVLPHPALSHNITNQNSRLEAGLAILAATIPTIRPLFVADGAASPRKVKSYAHRLLSSSTRNFSAEKIPKTNDSDMDDKFLSFKATPPKRDASAQTSSAKSSKPHTPISGTVAAGFAGAAIGCPAPVAVRGGHVQDEGVGEIAMLRAANLFDNAGKIEDQRTANAARQVPEGQAGAVAKSSLEAHPGDTEHGSWYISRGRPTSGALQGITSDATSGATARVDGGGAVADKSDGGRGGRKWSELDEDERLMAEVGMGRSIAKRVDVELGLEPAR